MIQSYFVKGSVCDAEFQLQILFGTARPFSFEASGFLLKKM